MRQRTGNLLLVLAALTGCGSSAAQPLPAQIEQVD
jgi:hypothetical protein